MALLGALFLPRKVRAESTERPAAEALFRSGRDAMKRGDWDTACARFSSAHQLDPKSPGPLLNLAQCEESRGHVVAAHDAFVSTLLLLPPEDERASLAKERAAALFKRIGRVVFDRAASAPADTWVSQANQRLPLGVEIRSHGTSLDVVVGADGFAARRLQIVPREGELVHVEVEPGERLVSTAAPTTLASGTNSMRTWAIAFGSLGALGLAAGATTGILAADRANTIRDHCDDAGSCDGEGMRAVSSGRDFSTASTISFGVGAVGIAAAVVLFLRAPSKPGPRSAWLSPVYRGNAYGIAGQF